MSSWNYVKSRGLSEKYYLKWAGIIHSIPQNWKKCIKQHYQDISGIKKQNKNKFLLKDELIDIKKITTKNIYEKLVEQKYTPPTAQSNLSKRIGNTEGIEWSNVYNRIYTNTIDTYLRMFQYKILNNILYLNFDLYCFKIIEFSTCSLCHSYPETVDHLFIECTEAINYYIQVKNWLRSFGVFLPELNKFDILLGVDDVLVNFVILLYKYSLYRSREKK